VNMQSKPGLFPFLYKSFRIFLGWMSHISLIKGRAACRQPSVSRLSAQMICLDRQLSSESYDRNQNWAETTLRHTCFSGC
jgi:hypothetical protein